MCVAWRTRCVIVCVCVCGTSGMRACVRVCGVSVRCVCGGCVMSPGVRVGAHLDVVHHPLHDRHRH